MILSIGLKCIQHGFSPNAIEALRVAAEDFANSTFADAKSCMEHAKRKTLCLADIELATFFNGGFEK